MTRRRRTCHGAGNPPAGIHLVERGRVSWGDWSMIEATLRMLRYAVDRLDADWFVLLSGEHRPAVDLQPMGSERPPQSGNDALLECRAASRSPSLRHERISSATNTSLEAATVGGSFARPRHRGRPPLHGPADETQLVRATDRVGGVHPSTRRVGQSGGAGAPTRCETGPSTVARSGSRSNRRAANAALAIDRRVAEWFEQSWIPDEAFLQTALRRVPGLVIANSTDHLRPRHAGKALSRLDAALARGPSHCLGFGTCRSCERSIPRLARRLSRASTAPSTANEPSGGTPPPHRYRPPTTSARARHDGFSARLHSLRGKSRSPGRQIRRGDEQRKSEDHRHVQRCRRGHGRHGAAHAPISSFSAKCAQVVALTTVECGGWSIVEATPGRCRANDRGAPR